MDTEAIKREAQTETQYPLFSPLAEQWERAVARIQALPPRTALVKRRGAGVAQIRTEPIPPYVMTAAQVSELERRLTRVHGVPVAEVDSLGGETKSPTSPLPLID